MAATGWTLLARCCTCLVELLRRLFWYPLPPCRHRRLACHLIALLLKRRLLACVQEGEPTHFGQPLVGCQAAACWQEVWDGSQFEARKASVAEYNAGTDRPCAAVLLACGALAPPHAPTCHTLLTLPFLRPTTTPTPHLLLLPPPPCAAHRFRKRGLAITPTKFGISFTTKFLNQAGALVHVYTGGWVGGGWRVGG